MGRVAGIAQKVVAGIFGTAATLAVLAVLVTVASAAGPQFPSSDDLPELPAGHAYGEPSRGCGSGGCFITVPVEAPEGVEPDEVIDALGLASDDCRSHGLLDRRERCTGAAVGPDGDVVVSVMLHDLGA